MTDLVLHRDTGTTAIALPEPRVPGGIAIRSATVADLQFIDDLQRKHARMVGWFPTKQLETNITRGQVLVAEQASRDEASRDQGTEASMPGCLDASMPVGYVISHDRYFKRDDCGIVYQLNVTPGKQRGLVGASLIKAVFDRAAYGCKLFSCWCAQDLEANHFWESIGFVPLAFRTGSRPRLKKDGTVSKAERIHIFWQRRIREGDTETPYWFPSETTGGAIRENRIALPIPPGTHWSDAKPAVLPGMDEALKSLPVPGAEVEKKPRKSKTPAVPVRPPSRGVWVAPPAPTKEQLAAAKKEKAKEKAPKFKNDPKLVAAARELRDRYIDQINAGLLLPPSACGKYDVSRQLAPGVALQAAEMKLLNAA